MQTLDLADFRRWGYDTRGWAQTTRQDYTQRLLRAHRWLRTHRNVHLRKASTDSLACYLSSLPANPSTRNNARDALLAYYRWAQATRRRRDNPAEALPRVREPRTVPQALDTDDVRLVLAMAQARGLKWRVALQLLVDCGPRASEVCRLEWPDISEGWVTVRRGKGGHGRALPLHVDTAALLASWRAQCPSPTWVLPGRWPDQPMSYQGLYYGVRAIGEAAGVDLHPHLLRSTYATGLLDSGAHIKTVSSLLGHASVATTSRYLAARDPLAVEAVAGLPWH